MISLMAVAISPEVFWPYFAGGTFAVIGILTVRKEVSNALGLDKIVVLGRLFFAVPLAIFGAQHFTAARFVARGVPSWIPGRMFWVYFVAVALFAAALSILVKIQARLSSTLLGVMLFLFVLLIHIPRTAASPGDRFAWAVALRDLSFAAGAWAMAGTHTEEWRAHGTNKLITLGRFLIGIPLLFFGVEHFLHPEFAPGVPLRQVTPPWIPFRIFWAYLAGTVLLAAGTSLLLGKRARLGATCLGIMLLLLVLFIYLPIMLAAPSDINNGLNYFADTLLFGGTALVLADAMPSRARD